MGADFYPQFLIGARVPMDKVIKTDEGEKLREPGEMGRQHRGEDLGLPKCPDFEIKEGMRNCPYCGNRLYTKYVKHTTIIPGLNFKLNSYNAGKYKNWIVARSTSKEYCFIGFHHLEGSQEDDCAYHGKTLKLDLKEISSKVRALREDLEAVGLWDEDSFGIWLFMQNSY